MGKSKKRGKLRIVEVLLRGRTVSKDTQEKVNKARQQMHQHNTNHHRNAMNKRWNINAKD